LDGADILRGYGGADWLYGGESTDTLNAGSDDYFIFDGNTEDDLRDVVYAGDGVDRVDGRYENDQIYGGAKNDTINIGFWGG
jgi:Ca2+-binding RTX toxin-like protein